MFLLTDLTELDDMNYTQLPEIINILTHDISSKLIKVAVVVCICAIAQFIIRFIRKRVVNPNAETAKEKRAETSKVLIYSVLKYAIYFLGFCQIMNILGFPIGSLLTFAGIGSVAIGFGAQSLIQDCITGVFIIMEGQYGVGDLITIDVFTGTVEAIGIRTTRIRSFDGNVHIIPNSGIKAVTNMTKGYKRALVNIRFSYEYPIDPLLKKLQEEMDGFPSNPDVLYQTPTVVGVIDMDQQSYVVRIAAQCKVGENWEIEREIRRRVVAMLQKENTAKLYPYYNIVVNNDSDKEKKA